MQLDGPGQKYIYNYISNLIIQWKRQNNKKENIRVTEGLEPEPRRGVEGYKRQTYNLVSRRGEILKKIIKNMANQQVDCKQKSWVLVQ